MTITRKSTLKTMTVKSGKFINPPGWEKFLNPPSKAKKWSLKEVYNSNITQQTGQADKSLNKICAGLSIEERKKSHSNKL